MSEKTLHFSIGPVQGFVGQARRTRDFWAGSFLLSWLAGNALNAVIKSGGKIIFPNIDGDPLMEAIASDEKTRVIPQVASLPNRFMAKVPDNFEPECCVEAVLSCWEEMTSKVYEKYILPHGGLGNGTKEIWSKQVNGFWEIVWAVGNDPRVLDRRKNWRTHVPTIEFGDKCTLMGGFQELSGYVRSISREQGNKQNQFWEAIRSRTRHGIKEKERLCAVAFVKRMFPSIAKEILFGSVAESYPSTPTLACANWLVHVSEHEHKLCGEYAKQASKLGQASEEQVPALQKLKTKNPQLANFIGLDPNSFFISSLENDNLWKENEKASRELRKDLVKLLKQFKTLPSPFYALLLMDGDKMGDLLTKNPSNVGEISRALGEFSKAAPRIVSEHNGVCVYAGGDDVMAMLPLEDVLGASSALHTEYRRAFERVKAQSPALQGIDEATISAAIIYAHQNTSLQLVVREAHTLLATVAKEATGRDSLAIKVLKSSGPNLVWSAPWEVVKAEQPPVLERLAADFSSDTPLFTSSFFYNLRQRFELLSDPDNSLLDSGDTEKVLLAEYLRSRKMKQEKLEEQEEQEERLRKYLKKAEANINNLLKICRPSVRVNGKVLWQDVLKLDGAMLIKFLATKGVER